MENLLDKFEITRYQLGRIMFFLGIASEFISRSVSMSSSDSDLKGLVSELTSLEAKESDTPSVGNIETNI